MDAFQNLIEDLGTATFKEMAVLSLRAFLAASDTPHFAYLGFRRSPADRQAPVRAGSYPSAWIDEYMGADLYAADPVVLSAATSTVPISWSKDLPEPIDPHGRSTELFERAAAHGIRSGFTVPIRSGIGHLATMTFASPLPWARFEHEVARFQSQFHLASFYFHQAMERLLAPVNAASLTEREKLCLTLASQGLSMKEIARTIDLSPRTVRFHHDNARLKLGAANLRQAIVNATCLGLI